MLDKRYCFNHFDPPTTTEDLLVAYYEHRTRHTLTALLRAAHASHNDFSRYWRSDFGTHTMLTREQYEQTCRAYSESLQGDYFDAHEWYFTLESFARIMIELRYLGLLPFDEIRGVGTQTNDVSMSIEVMTGIFLMRYRAESVQVMGTSAGDFATITQGED